jgi:hypothetical protein
MHSKTYPKSAARTARNGKRTQSQSFPIGEVLIIVGAGMLIALVAVVILLKSQESSPSRYPLNVDLAKVPDTSLPIPNQGQGHIQVGAPHTVYNSNPPTSGPHYADPAELGVYTSQLADETLVHNLEHGHIWLSYRDANDQEAVNFLADLQRRNSRYVIVTYRPQNATRITAAAWTRLFKTDDLNANQLQAFIVRYQDRAPESIPGAY